MKIGVIENDAEFVASRDHVEKLSGYVLYLVPGMAIGLVALGLAATGVID